MAKKMISRLSVLTVLIVFLAACSKTVEYTNIIPADATVVTSINLKSLTSKAGLNDKENEAAKQKVLEALKSGMNAATFQQLEKVMNNPSESGIDVEAPVYVFTSPSFPYSTAVAKIKSEDDLHASLEIMVKEQICQPINEAAGYSFTTMNGGLVAFNNSTVMLISVKGTSQIEKAKEGITNLLKQTADNSIAKSGAFQKMEKQKSDINFFASMAAIPAPYQEQVSMGLPAEVKAEDITIIAGLNFEKGRIALKTENYTENEAVKALMKKQLEAFGKANNTFVKYFPASTLMFVNLGIKGEGLYNLLSENKEFRNTVSISKADEVKELFSSFNGDISAGLINVTMNSAPTFIVYADVKNGNALEALYKNKQALGLKKGEDILELGKNEYVYKSKGMNVFADRNSVTSDIWHQDLIFRKGEMYLIEAASGTGKSSLCSYIYGYRNDYQGIINFDETNIKAYSVKQWVDLRKHSLSMLFQDLRIFTELTALENVQLKNNLTGYKKKKEILA